MTTNRWESLPTTPIGHRGEVISLTAASTAQALAAYLAGPRFVQRVPRSHGLVREQIGDGPWRIRAADEADIADVQEGLETFMHSLGLPAPPATDEWRLHLPQGLTSTDFAAAIDDPAIPAYTESNGREVVAAVTRRLEQLLGPLN